MGNENILHYAGIRLRVQGTGDLIPEFINLDDTPIQTLEVMPMSGAPTREPLRLANFTGQRVRLKVSTSNIDEIMIVNRVIIYNKPLWADFPA